jgi:hypothetical protein
VEALAEALGASFGSSCTDRTRSRHLAHSISVMLVLGAAEEQEALQMETDSVVTRVSEEVSEHCSQAMAEEAVALLKALDLMKVVEVHV